MKGLKKFKTNIPSVGWLVLADSITLVLYLCCLSAIRYNTNDVVHNEAVLTVLHVISNLLLVLFSVMSASIVSVPLIDVHEKNTLCNQMLAGDVLGSPQFISVLSEEQKQSLHQSLESALYFSGHSQKAAMYNSVKRKINGFAHSGDSDSDYYLDRCQYKVRCEKDGDYIKKTIIKRMEIRAYSKVVKHNFPLCATSFAGEGVDSYLSISSLRVNNVAKIISDSVATETGKSSDPLSTKSGYIMKSKHTYAHTLSLSPDRPAVVEVEYSTTVHQNDTVYICRISCPCKKFDFDFSLHGHEAPRYNVNLSAFGFIDDGSTTTNHYDDDPSVSISMDDWIFPRDGVAVTITEKVSAVAEASEVSVV